MSERTQRCDDGEPRPRTRQIGRLRLTTMLSFVGGVVVAAFLLPAGITAATNNPPLNILISDPDNNDHHAKVDAAGALKVASTGTSTVTGSVTVANTPLPVSGVVAIPDRPADFQFVHTFELGAGDTGGEKFHPADMSLITFPSGSDDELSVLFFHGGLLVFRIGDNESLPPALALTQPIRADSVQVSCDNESDPCKVQIDIVGDIAPS